MWSCQHLSLSVWCYAHPSTILQGLKFQSPVMRIRVKPLSQAPYRVEDHGGGGGTVLLPPFRVHLGLLFLLYFWSFTLSSLVCCSVL